MQEIINKMVIVNPQIRIWSGSTKLNPQDVGGVDLPKKFASLGNKKLVPASTITPFDSLKKRTERMLERHGPRLIGGFAIAEETLEAVVEKLLGFQDQFNRLKAEFIQEFPSHVDQQCEEFPAHCKGIRQAAWEIQPYLEERFGFDFKVYKLVPSGREKEGGNHFPKDEEFISQASAEVGKEANEALTRLSQHTEVKQVFLNSVRNIKGKLLNLASLDRQVFGCATTLVDMVLGEMPPKGPIDGRERKLLTALLILLRSLKDEFHRRELIAGNYNDPETLMLAMGCEEIPVPKSSNKDNADAAGHAAERTDKEPEHQEEEEFVWF